MSDGAKPVVPTLWEHNKAAYVGTAGPWKQGVVAGVSCPACAAELFVLPGMTLAFCKGCGFTAYKVPTAVPRSEIFVPNRLAPH